MKQKKQGVRQVDRGQIMWGLVGHSKEFTFSFKRIRKGFKDF